MATKKKLNSAWHKFNETMPADLKLLFDRALSGFAKQENKNQVRVLRVIEYVGDSDTIQRTLQTSIHGERRFGNMLIRSAIVGYPLQAVATDLKPETATDKLLRRIREEKEPRHQYQHDAKTQSWSHRGE